MSAVNGKRITFKRNRPNPLFQEWLEELYDEAKQKGSKLESLLQEALSSMSKYPLPLHSGAECAILKGFDKRLCLFIDKRLDVYRSSAQSSGDISSRSSASSVSGDEVNSMPSINIQSTSEDNKIPYVTPSPEFNEIFPSISSKSLCKNISKRKYKPTYRSANYAFLLALRDLKKNQKISKEQLTSAAQKYSDGNINSEWRNMLGLIRRGLVIKCTRNGMTQFCLTDTGVSIANDLCSRRSEQNRTSVNNVILNNNLADNIDTLPTNKNANNEPLILNNIKSKLNSNAVIHEDKSDVNDLLYDENIGNIMPINSMHKKNSNFNVIENVENHVDFSKYVEMAPGSYDIVLLVDIHETSGSTKKNDPTVALFNKYPELKHEYRSLKVGDFTWIAQNRTNRDQELVLPYVVERKRMDDLGNSIKDGRFHEQKFRLRKCGLNHVIYMVEHHGNNKHVGLPMLSLMQALTNTTVQDGFKVHITDSLAHSVRFLATMTLRLIYEYKDKHLKGHNGEPSGEILMTFEHFNNSSVKNRALSVTDTFIKLLLQLKGVSVEKALTITNVYKTPRMLIEKYKSCDPKEGEMLLSSLKFGEMNRSIGPGVSKSIYQLFTCTDIR